MKRRLIFLTLLLTGTFLGYFDAMASGPGVGGRRVRLDNEPGGPYLIRAVTSPSPATVGNFNVEVKVILAADGQEVIDARVVIKAEPVDFKSDSFEEPATHDFAPLPTEYAAHLPIPEVGLWLVTIQVESEPGFGEVSFYQEVSNPPNLSILVSVGAPVGGLLLLLLVFFWLQKNSRAAAEGTEQDQ
ncbi:MAG: hypothetical protein E4G99_07230 [Anaerolineales bacterium]|nr:MAG: hypothetical protein E4G99_07230 [Anaerolineales bacterium]